jgi:hypothetical protein
MARWRSLASASPAEGRRPHRRLSVGVLLVASTACASVDSAASAGDAATPGVTSPRLPTRAPSDVQAEPRPGEPSASPAEGRRSPTRPSDARVLGKLRLKNVDLTLASTGVGARFAVTPRGEAPSAVPLTEQGLAERHPELYEVYRSSQARQGPYLDARLDQPRSESENPGAD